MLSDVDSGEVLITVKDGVVILTLNRPEVLNAFNGAMHTKVAAALAAVAADPSVRALVLTGSGAAFSSGGDLGWFTSISDAELDLLFDESRDLIYDLLSLSIPVISAVNGPAIGLGATLALFADCSVMADTARIGDPHVRIGVAAGDGGAVIWPWLVGINRAKQFLLSGEILRAKQAYEIGLVNYVVAPDELMTTARDVLDRLLSISPLAFAGTKRALNQILRGTVDLVFESCLAAEKECFATPEHKELVRKFAAQA